MRVVGKDEREKRGCLYCLDCKKRDGQVRALCKHDECPYHELDDYENYEDYFKAQGTALTGLFEEVAK